VLAIVLPAVTAPGAISGLIAAVADILSVRVIYISIIVIYVDIIISSPSTIATPAPVHGRSNHHPNTKRDGRSSNVSSRRRVVDRRVGVRGCAIHHDRVIAGSVNDLRLGLLDDDYALAFHNLSFDLHLLAGFQVSLLLSLPAHALHSIHHVGLLGQDCIPKIRRPLDVACQSLDDIGKRSH
jgi:hypothetical protein